MGEMDKNNSLTDMMDQRKIKEIDGNMKKLLAEMEVLGDEGKVDEAQLLLRQVEQLQAQKDAIANRPPDEEGAGNFDDGSHFTVCDICGVFQAVNDAESRHWHLSDRRGFTQFDHLQGKQHRGYELIRNKITDLEKLHETEREERRKSREAEREKERAERDNRR